MFSRHICFVSLLLCLYVEAQSDSLLRLPKKSRGKGRAKFPIQTVPGMLPLYYEYGQDRSAQYTPNIGPLSQYYGGAFQAPDALGIAATREWVQARKQIANRYYESYRRAQYTPPPVRASLIAIVSQYPDAFSAIEPSTGRMDISKLKPETLQRIALQYPDFRAAANKAIADDLARGVDKGDWRNRIKNMQKPKNRGRGSVLANDAQVQQAQGAGVTAVKPETGPEDAIVERSLPETRYINIA